MALHSKSMNWFAVITKPRQECLALEHLQRQGFECFLPRAQISNKRRKRKTQSTSEPLFPGYLFIQANPEKQSLAPVRSTRGVLQMLRFGLKLAVVPDRVVDLLKSRTSSETGLIDLTLDQFESGDKVRVLDGPMAGLNGIFKEQSKEARAILLLNLLGRETKVEIDSLLLERA